MNKELISLAAAVENLAAADRALFHLVGHASSSTYYQAWGRTNDAWHTAEGLLAGLEEAEAAETARLDAEDALDTRGKEEGR